MARQWPQVVYKEEGMREGMQIEDSNITVEDKVRLLDALSETGLKTIVVGSFVSPKWTPQMTRIDEVVSKFHPKPGVKYTALAVNARGVERAREYSPPLTIERDPWPRLNCHVCDVFTRRNYNRSQMQEMERWPQIVAQAQEQNVTEGPSAPMPVGAPTSWATSPWMSSCTFWSASTRCGDEAGIKVVSVAMGDPMSWCRPDKVEESLEQVKARWPEIRHFRLHLHNGRNMSIASAYAAMRVLEPEDTLELDGTIGGIGGCPYCGNGRATGMAPTEDLLHMMDGMGIDTGINMDKLIDCVWMLEEVLGRTTYGHVSKAGPRPQKLEELYDPNAPFIETMEQAKHFKLGPRCTPTASPPTPSPSPAPTATGWTAGFPSSRSRAASSLGNRSGSRASRRLLGQFALLGRLGRCRSRPAQRRMVIRKSVEGGATAPPSRYLRAV